MSAPAIAKVPVSRASEILSTKGFTTASLVMADLMAVSFSGAFAMFVRRLLGARISPVQYLDLLPVLGVFFGVAALAGLYPGIAENPIREFRRVLGAVSITYLILVGATFLLKDSNIYSRLIFVASWFLSIVCVLCCRAIVRLTFSHAAWWGVPTVILGGGRTGQAMLDVLQRSPALGLRPVALLDQNTHLIPASISRPEGLIVGDLSLAPEIARLNGGCYAIVAMPELSSAELADIVSTYAGGFSQVFVIPDCFGLSSLWVSANEIGGVLGLQVSQPLAQPISRAVKRVFDIMVVGLLSLALLPFFVILLLSVVLTSRGPAFYGQRRIGRGDQPFTAWKFRTMVANAEEVLQCHLDADPGLRDEWLLNHKLRRDPRVTVVGRFLRKTSLDELPQLWNVLRGEMSLVGPRPIVLAEVTRYGRRFDLYRKVAPGITGLWQVSGRNNTTYDERTRLDEYYVRNWSVYLDLYILYRTIKTVVLTEGAY
jgi:Undecaprenyl-phosphate galactose phosphotransferase WbaP